MPDEETRRDLILLTVGDLVSTLLYYGRKDDEELPEGEIEAAIEAGEITTEEILTHFEQGLREHI